MPLFSTAQVFDGEATTRLMTVKVNGGSLLVEAKHSVGPDVWITADTIIEDGVFVVNFDVLGVRLTPTGGATFGMAIRT